MAAIKKSLYLAAPLFSDAERRFNLDLDKELSKRFAVFLPQRDGRLIINLLAEGIDVESAKRIIFTRDVQAIQESDVVLAVLDGQSIDEGVAVELGLAYAYGKTCWGLKTDFRSLAWFGDNPMVEALLTKKFSSVEELFASVSLTNASELAF
jgi:nucleoside 2-deoxyribosyltransferase